MIERLSSKKIAKARKTFYLADVEFFFYMPDLFILYYCNGKNIQDLVVLKSQVTMKRVLKRIMKQIQRSGSAG